MYSLKSAPYTRYAVLSITPCNLLSTKSITEICIAEPHYHSTQKHLAATTHALGARPRRIPGMNSSIGWHGCAPGSSSGAGAQSNATPSEVVIQS